MSTESIRLTHDNAVAEIALRGAEPLVWQVGGRDLLWGGDPEHWSYRAPILFPVVGASAGGVVRVGGEAYPMAQHGFARISTFEPVARDAASVRLRLVDDASTRALYPFRFDLEVAVTLSATALTLVFTVTNPGPGDLPYALGFHPAFPWPFAAPSRDGHLVRFEAEETAEVPEVAPGGLLAQTRRGVPLDGRILPLAPELFSEALVFLDAKSRAFSFEAPAGAAITMSLDGFPHLAIWSRPTAPFLSLEAWTGHADWEDFSGELAERASMILLPPGGMGRHAVTLAYRDADADR